MLQTKYSKWLLIHQYLLPIFIPFQSVQEIADNYKKTALSDGHSQPTKYGHSMILILVYETKPQIILEYMQTASLPKVLKIKNIIQILSHSRMGENLCFEVGIRNLIVNRHSNQVNQLL